MTITPEKAVEILKKSGCLPNIMEHSLLVAEVTKAICDNLKDKSQISTDLAVCGAILHDVTKTQSLQTGEHHDISGGIYMRELGEEKIASIIESHVALKEFSIEAPLNEEEIVHYADKRVKHSEIVTINERIEDLIIRYGNTPERKKDIASRIHFLRDLENKIQSRMTASIDSVIPK